MECFLFYFWEDGIIIGVLFDIMNYDQGVSVLYFSLIYILHDILTF